VLAAPFFRRTILGFETNFQFLSGKAQ